MYVCGCSPWKLTDEGIYFYSTAAAAVTPAAAAASFTWNFSLYTHSVTQSVSQWKYGHIHRVCTLFHNIPQKTTNRTQRAFITLKCTPYACSSLLRAVDSIITHSARKLCGFCLVLLASQPSRTKKGRKSMMMKLINFRPKPSHIHIKALPKTFLIIIHGTCLLLPPNPLWWEFRNPWMGQLSLLSDLLSLFSYMLFLREKAKLVGSSSCYYVALTRRTILSLWKAAGQVVKLGHIYAFTECII